MNTVPRLIEHPSWQTIASFSGNELIEFAMLGLLSLGVIAVGIYWAYRAAAALWKR